MATAYPIQQMADGGVKYSDGTVKYSTPTNAVGTGTGGYAIVPSKTTPVKSATETAPPPAAKPSAPAAPPNPQEMNPAQRNDWAISQGYDGWNQYQDKLREMQSSVPSGPSDQELNSAYQPLMDYLGQAESALRSDYPTYQNEINANYNTSKQQLDNSRMSGQNTLDSQMETANKSKLDAISEARRLYNELNMASQQRFGGSSTAGQASSEILGREFQRGSSRANEAYGQLAKELNTKKFELDQNYQVSLQQLNDKKQSSLNEVQRSFQDKLLQINQMRANTESEKANRRLQALQDYRNQVYQVQLQNFQMVQQLEMMKAQSQMELENYGKQLEMAKSYGAGATSNALSVLQTPTSYSTVQGGQQTTAAPLTGVRSNEDLYLQGYAPGLYDTRYGQVGSSANPTLLR